MRIQTIFLQIVLLTLIAVAGGCFSSNQRDIESFVRPSKVDVSADTYILQPPDEIEIHCSKVPEIHLQSQRIRPDGKVTFEALGEIHAAGKTPNQLAELMHEKILLLYALTGEHPIDVRIVTYRSKWYYVIGQVHFSGPKVFTGRDTVLKAIAQARPSNLAWVERIQVVRPSADKKVKPKIFELNYEKMIVHGDSSKNVLLEEGDIVYVPPTVLAAIGLKVEELVSPIGRAFSTVNIVQGPPGR